MEILPELSSTTSPTDTTTVLDNATALLPSQILSLPAEIRNEIYYYLFQDVKLGLANIHKDRSDSNSSLSSSSYSCASSSSSYSSSNLSSYTFSTSPPSPSAVQPTIQCGSFCYCAFPYALTTACRSLRRESLPLLLRNTTLEISSNLSKTSLLSDYFLSMIPRAVILDAKLFANFSRSPASPSLATTLLRRLVSLQTLELRNITVWCKWYKESDLESEEADEAMINLALFNLRRISLGLSELCMMKPESRGISLGQEEAISSGSDEDEDDECTGVNMVEPVWDEENNTRKFNILLGCHFVGNSMGYDTVQAIIDVDNRTVLQKSKGATVRDRNEWAGFY